MTGNAARLHHDALIEGGPPLWVVLPLFVVAWQVMVAAMMIPSSLPLIRLFVAVSDGQERPQAGRTAFLAGSERSLLGQFTCSERTPDPLR